MPARKSAKKSARKSAKKKVHWRKGASAKKKKKKRARPKAGKARHARRRHRKRHPKSRVASHHKRLFDEAETANYLLHQILKTTAADPDKPYHYDPRHYSKDLEYATGNERLREFKKGVPAPDVQMWRPDPYEMGPYTEPAVLLN